MVGSDEMNWREAMYRQFARQAGLPAGLRPELIKRAERCASRAADASPISFSPLGGVQGCKGAVSR